SDIDQEQIVQAYREACVLSQQGRYGEAIAKYEQAISAGARSDEPIVLKLASAALRLSAQCQFHLCQKTEDYLRCKLPR
ncbi:MAG: hypothetical protein QMC90_01745, partial [Dehalococcoidales bacterium]|nr:hypothetical protein [Dehalococcoidales bacterium]